MSDSSTIPEIVRESAAGKAAGKKWMITTMNKLNAFISNGQLSDTGVPTVVLQDCMGAVKGVRRNTVTMDPMLPVTTAVATASDVLLHPVLRSFRHYSERARANNRGLTMILCFDYYGVENNAKQLCHAMRAELSDVDEETTTIPLQESYIQDWEKPLPENWADLMKSRDVAMPVIIRDITKEILRLYYNKIPTGQRLIICGHSLDTASVQRQGHNEMGLNFSDDDLRQWPLVIKDDKTVSFLSDLRVDQIEGDLQMFSLLKMVSDGDDTVHVISTDTDVMYYAMWYAASLELPQVKHLLWKHQWSNNGDSWLDVYQLCKTIDSDPQFGKKHFTEPVKNLVACLVATGTDYTSGFQGIGHVKWMKPMTIKADHTIAPLFGNENTKKHRMSSEPVTVHTGLNHKAYYELAALTLGSKKMWGNEQVVRAVGGQLDYFIQRFLQSVGYPTQPQTVKMVNFPFDSESKCRLYEPVHGKGDTF